MRYSAWCITALVLCSLFSSLLVVEPVRADPMDGDWWDSDWSYRKEITVSNKIESYQNFLNITKTSGGDANCSGNCNNNFSDLRFTANNGTFIPYWIEDKVDGSYAHVWVNNKWNGTTLYMYYGNSDAETLSNGTETFVYFNDFSSSTSISKTDYGNGAYYYFGSFNLTGGFIVNYDWYIYSLKSHKFGAVRSWSLANDDNTQLVYYFQDSDDTDHGIPPLVRLDDFYGVSTATWYEVTSKYIPDTEHKLYLDDVLIDTHASPDIDTSFTRVRWQTADYTNGVTDLTWDAVNERLDAVGWRRDSGGYLKAYIDNFYIAKFASLEPSYTFGSQERIGTYVELSHEHPANNAVGVEINVLWNITITSMVSFNWSIESSNGQNTSGTDDTNGSKELFLTGLSLNTQYMVWVNASTIDGWTNATYHFTTRFAQLFLISEPLNNSCTYLVLNHTVFRLTPGSEDNHANSYDLLIHVNTSTGWEMIGLWSNITAPVDIVLSNVSMGQEVQWNATLTENGTANMELFQGMFMVCEFPCPSIDLIIHEHISNATGSTDSSYDEGTGWTVWANYTGNVTFCPSTNLTVFENLVNITGNYTSSYSPATGWTLWLNYTGLGGVFSGMTDTGFQSLVLFSLFILFFAWGYTSSKKSGGALLLFSGFPLMALTMMLSLPTLIAGFSMLIAIYIMIMGIMKWFFHVEKRGEQRVR